MVLAPSLGIAMHRGSVSRRERHHELADRHRTRHFEICAG